MGLDSALRKAEGAARVARFRTRARLHKNSEWGDLTDEQREQREQAAIAVVDAELDKKKILLRREWDNLNNKERSPEEPDSSASEEVSIKANSEEQEAADVDVGADSFDDSEDGLGQDDEWVDSDGNEISKEQVVESLTDILKRGQERLERRLVIVENLGSFEELPFSETEDEEEND